MKRFGRQGGEGKCKYCGADIQWAINRKTGAPTPLNPQPDTHFGNLLVDEWSWTFVQLDFGMIERAIARGERLYVNHLQHCPILRPPKSVIESSQLEFR
jgi:hypothetical protein